MSSFQLYEVDMHLEELRDMVIQKCRLFNNIFFKCMYLHFDLIHCNQASSDVCMHASVSLCVYVKGKSDYVSVHGWSYI